MKQYNEESIKNLFGESKEAPMIPMDEVIDQLRDIATSGDVALYLREYINELDSRRMEEEDDYEEVENPFSKNGEFERISKLVKKETIKAGIPIDEVGDNVEEFEKIVKRVLRKEGYDDEELDEIGSDIANSWGREKRKGK